MSNRSTGKPRQCPVVVGVVIASPDSATSERTFLKGACVVTDVEQWQQVESLFFESARAMQEEPPAGFEFQVGEILYDKQRIAVVRMACSRASRLGKKGRVTGETWWNTSEKVQCGYDPGYGLVLPQGRTYFAAMRHKRVLMLAWDVRANAEGHDNSYSEVNQRLIRVTVSADDTQDYLGDQVRFRMIISHANSIIAAAAQIKDLLLQLMDDVYTDYNREHLTALSYAFKHLLEHRVMERRHSDFGVGNFRIKPLDEHELKKRLLNAVMEVARAELRIEKGRPPGSKDKKRRSATKKSLHERKIDIQRVISEIYEEARQVNNELTAEDWVNKLAVADRLKIHRNTLNNWLRKGNLDFQDMKDKGIRASNRKRRAS